MRVHDIEKVEINREGRLVITCILKETPEVSASQKSIVIASSHGNQRVACEFEGKPITIGLNAYVPNPDRPRRPSRQ